MAVAIAVHSRKFTFVTGITLRDGCLVDLCAVLVLRTLDLKRTGIAVLIHASAIIPAFSERTIQVQRHFLQAEMIGLVVKCSVKTILSQLRERVDSITDIASCNGSFSNLKQSLMTQTGIATPKRIDAAGIGCIGNRQTVLKHIDISRRQTNLYLTWTVGTGSVQHHVTIALFLVPVILLATVVILSTDNREGRQSG